MKKRLALLPIVVAILLAPMTGCETLRPRPPADLEVPHIEMPRPERPGSNGKVYSLNPRMQSVERNLGLR